MNLQDLFYNPNEKAFGESMGFGEADEEDIPSGEMTDEGPADEGGGGDEFSGGGDDDFGGDFGDEDSGDGEGGDGKVEDPMEDVDEADEALVKDMRTNMTTFYNNREEDLEKILSSALISSEHEKEVVPIIEKYKTALTLLKSYLRNKYYEDATSIKVTTFIEYKTIFNKLNKTLNDYFRMIGIEGISDV